MGRFKANAPNQGKFKNAYIGAGPISNGDDYPTFAFRLTNTDYCISSCSQNFKIALADKIRILSAMTWAQIRVSRREQHGFEKIPRDQIRGLPALTADVTKLDVCRFHGVEGRLICLIEGKEIRVYLVDHTLSSYSHG